MAIDAKAILAEVRANHARLKGCARHRFPAKGDNYRLGEKLTCLACGGELDLIAVGNYIRGYVAHGGAAADILPDWKEL